MISLSSCEDVFDTKDPGPAPDTQAQTYYMAIQIANTDDVSTRADYFDSDAADAPTGFNQGLPSERYIYPSTVNDKWVNYAILFDKDNKRIEGNLLELWRWDGPNNDNKDNYDEDDTSTPIYNVFYTALKGEEIINQLTGGKILVILNANSELITELEKTSNNTYSSLTNLLISKSTSKPDFLYLKVGNTLYHTMTSSMVIETLNDGLKTLVPAVDNELTFHSSLQEAQDHPFKLYAERLQAKHTLLFQKKNNETNYYFSGTNEDGTEYTDENKTYQAKKRLIFSSTNHFTPKSDFTKLRYVKEYTRGTSIQDPKDRPDPIFTEADWKVNITGWAPNGLEKSEYVFKKLTHNSTPYNTSATWWYPSNTTLAKVRNYWAEDPHYTEESTYYPDQFRTATNSTSLKYYTDAATLEYKGYSTLAQRFPRQYSPENTFDPSSIWGANIEAAYKSKAYLRVGTHIIVTAQLLIKGFDEEEIYSITESNEDTNFNDEGLAINGTQKATDKYYMYGIFWSEDAYKEYVAEYLGYCLQFDSNTKVEKIKNEEDGTEREYIPKFGPNDGNFYVLESSGSYRVVNKDDFETEKAYIKGGDGYVRIKPKDGKILYIKNGTDSYISLQKLESDYHSDEENVDLFKNLVYEHPEYMAGHFNEGRMYYPLAIKHNTSSTSGVNSIALGDYGVVRNHWYYFTINNIVSPGTPVDDPSQLIIPNNEPEYEALGFNITILNWHTVDAGDVDVSDQQRPS